jgi:hypothetical protein
MYHVDNPEESAENLGSSGHQQGLTHEVQQRTIET